MTVIKVRDIPIGDGQDLVVMSGPCVIESLDHCLYAAEHLKKIFSDAGIPFIFKSSYDKANRSSLSSFRGPGLEEGLKILQRVKDEFDVPIVSDIHTPEDAAPAAEVCDILQIPAFLCRQTSLLLAAGNTKAAVSIKKGQFLAPWDMGNAVEKVRSCGNDNVIVTERGSSFGYNNLVSDMRSIPIMKKLPAVVCYDATHSVQLPGGHGTSSGGQVEFIPPLAKAAIAAGCHCLFMEAHPNPAEAKSDKDSQIRFEELPELLATLKRIYNAVHEGE